MIEIILATANLHKISEFRTLFRQAAPWVDLTSLLQYPDYRLPEETGTTFEENAQLKAVDASNYFGKISIADDSGLVVPAIGGRPGVYSARYAGAGATDHENRIKLLEEMKGLEGVDRYAYFECVLCIAKEGQAIHFIRGRCEGRIVESERGRNGFGYDSLFCKHDYDKTFSELDDSTKNRISHRGKAFEKLLILLESKNL